MPIDTSFAPFRQVSRKLFLFKIWQSFDMLCVGEHVRGREGGFGFKASFWRSFCIVNLNVYMSWLLALICFVEMNICEVGKESSDPRPLFGKGFCLVNLHEMSI